MPPQPKKKKDATDAPVLAMAPEEQVRLLAQGLLREYMHKKGFTETLRVFDEENPRDENTISSRALMSDLMTLDDETQQRLKAEGLATIMEMLCGLRTEKRVAAETRIPELRRGSELPVPEMPEIYERALKWSRESNAEGGENGEANEDAARKRERKARKKAAKEKKEKKRAKALAAMVKPEVGVPQMTFEELLEQGSTVPKAAGSRRRDSDQGRGSAPGHESGSRDSTTVLASGGPRTAPGSRRLLDNLNQKADGNAWKVDSSSSSRSSRSDSSGSSRSSSDRGGRNDPRVPAGRAKPFAASSDDESEAANSTVGPTGWLHDEFAGRASAVGERHARAILDLLVGPGSGGKTVPASFVEQGLIFSKHVPYGLVQVAGGPCGVLAVVQAQLLRFLFAEVNVPSDAAVLKRRCECLLDAVLCVIQRAQPLPSRIVIVNGGPARGGSAMDISQLQMITGLETMDVVRRCVRACLADWQRPHGGGLFHCLLSILLSHTMEATQKDMDAPSALIVENGYCAQELTNLCLTGTALSNVHDGAVCRDGMMLRGYTKELDCGFLSYAEYLGHHVVGDHAKHCRYPCWVVYHESHYSVLFMKRDSRSETVAKCSAGETASFDLFYWDQLGEQQQEIRLTVTLPSHGTAPVRRPDALVPYLNDIIRTMAEWCNARVSWNGSDPLL